MIGPSRFKDMLRRFDTVLVANPTEAAADMMPSDADRLEAALDAAMASASNRPYGIDASRARVRVPLKDLRAWLGDDHYGWLGEGKWVWTKWEVARLFDGDGGVNRRYVDGGWAKCTCGWDSQQERGVTFTFLTEDAVRRDERERIRVPNVEGRAAEALAALGEILGVGRVGDPKSRESITEYLENLRMASRYMRFDLEAERREGQSMARPANDEDDDDGYCPPFEGSPDDDNFGNR